jgi:hypothetical protein
MDRNTEVARDNFALEKRSRWKNYVYGLVGAEISTTARFCDQCIQVAPLSHDTGLLFDAIECPAKTVVGNSELVEDHRHDRSRRVALLFNGNFCYLADIEAELKEIKGKLSRHSRLFVVLYNPFMRFMYVLARWLQLRQAPLPDTFLTGDDLQNICRLAGYEIVRTRPAVFFPFPVPFLASFLNRLLPLIPLIKRLSLVWVVVLRPVLPDTAKPSLSIIIPARNEAGNVDGALDRLPQFPGTELEVIFVEGNSSDDTWQNIQHAAARQHANFSVKALQQTGKGKYDAVRLGFANASHEVVTILDADLTMPPEMLPRFYDAYCSGLGDFINGNRLLYQMEREAMRPLNRLGNLFFAKCLAWVLGMRIGDSLCGTKMFSARDYRRFEEWRARFGDFDPFGDFEMLFAASELGLGTQDVPIRYRARTYGETQISRFADGFKLMRMTLIGFWGILLGKIR